MKTTFNLVLVIMLSFSALAQKDYLAKDFGYTNDLKKVEEIEYNYDSNAKKYIAVNRQTYNFENGKLIRSDFAYNSITYNQGEKVFTYKDGFPESYTIISNGLNEKYTFKYTNGKLTEEVDIDGDDKRIFLFKYNPKGQKTECILNKNGAVIRIEEFKNYTNDNSYVEVVKKFENNKLTSTVTSTFRNGKLFAISSDPNFIPEKETRVYDTKGNIIQYTGFDNIVYKNNYVYDNQGNPNQLVRIGNPESKYNKGNTFVFTKIYYTNGKTTGTTDLDEKFVRQYDKNSESYDFDDTFSNKKILASEILYQEFEFMKSEDAKISVHIKGGDEITNSVRMCVNKNKLDIIVYDSESQETAIAKDFYNPNTPVNKWITMETQESTDSDIYWLIDDESKLYFIMFGQYMSTDSFTIVKSTKSEYDLIIQQDGKNRYMLINPNMSKRNIVNPLELYYE